MNRSAVLVAPAALLLAAASASAVNVNIELSLLVDVSGSIDSSEYDTQLRGYARAFGGDGANGNANFFNSVVHAGNSIAVNFVEWSGQSEQAVTSINGAHPDGWWVISSQADATAFGNMIVS